MKFTKIFRILTLAVILSLLLVVIPASPALAVYDYDIELDPDEGEIGEYFDVEGDDWPPSNYTPTIPIIKEVDIYFSSEEADTGDDIDDEVAIYEERGSDEIDDDGDFKKRVRVPTRLTDGDESEDVHGGTYYVYVTMEGSKDIKAVAEFKVIAGEIELDPTEDVVGTEVDITGGYFAGSEDITVEYDADDIDRESGDDKTDSDGEFECSILIPESTAGEHTITVTGDEGSEASATFTVEPEITIDPTSGAADDEVTVTGTGFGEEVYVDICFGVTVVAVPETDDYGSFTTTFEVLDVAEGSYNIKVEDDDRNKDAADFTVYIASEVSISPVTSQASPGHVGTNITISGVGFEANSTITITYTSEPYKVTTQSGPDGAFTATFKVPESKAGTHLITVSDGVNTLTSTFIMESEAPPIPPPLLPEMDAKAESLTEFDWEDVTDDSLPVTYTLQVATNENFTSASIVLEKEGLTDSDYTITEKEKLDPTKKEDPYYWRVKATDSASNESQWSAPGSFYIGGFAWPSWRIHLWWGLGVLGAVFFGFWLGKRRAYYSY